LGVVEQFLNHIHRHKLCKTSDKILLAVSGGMDSMVMLHLFVKAGFNPAVAHCNFQLRGEASSADEKLVAGTCENLKVTCHVTRFETAKVADESKDSIQLAARKLRYNFFNELREQHHYQFLATAHHINDSLETILFNLVRGTGIDGLLGIPVKNEWIIRPMLFASREMVERYAIENNILWREDASNAEDDYQRNFIRLHVISRLRELNPSLEETFQSSNERIRAMVHLAKNAFGEISRRVISEADGKMNIDIEAIQKFDDPAVILWELLKDKGVNYAQCKQIVLEHQPGKRFLAGDVTITIGRNHYIVEQGEAELDDFVIFSEGETEVILNDQKLVCRQVASTDFVLIKQPGVAQFDAAKIQFPLRWRRWKNGDAFTPLGMHSRKKVSDLLIDEKISLPEKKKMTVLESAGEIVWVVGLRIHDSFKVTEKTRKVLIIECLPV
jgi:tRNA(Ile)-lysidine synthase